MEAGKAGPRGLRPLNDKRKVKPVKTWSRVTAALLLCLLVASALASGWAQPGANQALYEEKYAEAKADLRAIPRGAANKQVRRFIDALTSLGYYVNRKDIDYGKTLEEAKRVFCLQMGVRDTPDVISPLVQAMLLDAGNMPRAHIQMLDVYDYSYDSTRALFTPYTYGQLSGAKINKKVCFVGAVAGVSRGDAMHYMLRMDGDDTRVVFVRHNRAALTTIFQPGDTVAVLGVYDGVKADARFPANGERPVVLADMIGFAQSP